MTEKYHLLIRKEMYRVKYKDNDSEDMTMQEVRIYWVKQGLDEDRSSSKK